jgi:hypothetical protein
LADGLPARWLLDSGSGNDLIGEDDTPASLPTTDIPSNRRPRLQTANGDITVDQRVVFALLGLGFPVNALQLHRTPAVLSLGKRCIEEGWSFRWDAWAKEPTFTDPNGKAVKVFVEGGIPHILMSQLLEDASLREAASPPPPPTPACPGAPEPEDPEPPEPLEDGWEDDASSITGDEKDPGEAVEVPEDEAEGDDDVKAAPRADILRAQAVSLPHLLCHRTKNPYCPSCQQAKMMSKPARRRRPEHVPVDERRFGRQLTADHVIYPA